MPSYPKSIKNLSTPLLTVLFRRFDYGCEKPQGLFRIVLHDSHDERRQGAINLVIFMAHTRHDLGESCVPLDRAVELSDVRKLRQTMHLINWCVFYSTGNEPI